MTDQTDPALIDEDNGINEPPRPLTVGELLEALDGVELDAVVEIDGKPVRAIACDMARKARVELSSDSRALFHRVDAWGCDISLVWGASELDMETWESGGEVSQ